MQSRLDIMPGPLRENSRKKSWWSIADSQDLGILLQKFGKSKAKDPRDIIYALLGLSKDAFESNTLRPNYDISLEEAIQRTVSYLLNHSKYGRHYLDSDHTTMPRWDLDQLLSALKEGLFNEVVKWNLNRERSVQVDSLRCDWSDRDETEHWVMNIPHPSSAICQKIWDRTVLVRKRRMAMDIASQRKMEMA